MLLVQLSTVLFDSAGHGAEVHGPYFKERRAAESLRRKGSLYLKEPRLQVTPADVEALANALESASWRGVHALKQVLPPAAAVRLLDVLAQLLKAEPTLVEARTIGVVPLSLVSGAS